MRIQDGALGLYSPQLADQVVDAIAAAATALTITLPASAGHYHAITSLLIVLTNTGVASAGAKIAVTSTNLRGLTTELSANLAAAQVRERQLIGARPLLSTAAGVATTITVPNPTGTVSASVVCHYALVPAA